MLPGAAGSVPFGSSREVAAAASDGAEAGAALTEFARRLFAAEHPALPETRRDRR
jgi:hypothetical protein